jgi:hypothetical protein
MAACVAIPPMVDWRKKKIIFSQNCVEPRNIITSQVSSEVRSLMIMIHSMGLRLTILRVEIRSMKETTIGGTGSVCIKFYLIYHKEEVLNTYQVYDTSGVLTKQDAHLEIVHKSDKKELTIKVLNKEFDKIQAVIGNFDFRYTLHPGAKVDTIRSLNNTTVVIPIQDDTVRGYVENFEWTQSNRGVSRGLFFCYPAKWRTTDGK